MTKLEAIGKIASCGRATDGEKMRAVELILESDESRAQEVASRFPSGAEILEAICSAVAEDEPPITGQGGSVRDKFAR